MVGISVEHNRAGVLALYNWSISLHIGIKVDPQTVAAIRMIIFWHATTFTIKIDIVT